MIARDLEAEKALLKYRSMIYSEVEDHHEMARVSLTYQQLTGSEPALLEKKKNHKPKDKDKRVVKIGFEATIPQLCVWRIALPKVCYSWVR